MPYQLRPRPRVSTAELTTTSTTSTFKTSSSSNTARDGSLKEHGADTPTLSKRSETKRQKRGRELTDNGVDLSATPDETPSLSKRKRRRVIHSKDLVSESQWTCVIKTLDMLYQAQETHQRKTTTMVGKIEIESLRLVAGSRELQDSQICRLLNEDCKHMGNQTRTLVADLAKDLLTQQRRLFEGGFKGIEHMARTLIADLVEGMSAQQRLVTGTKRFIEQHRAGKDGN